MAPEAEAVKAIRQITPLIKWLVPVFGTTVTAVFAIGAWTYKIDSQLNSAKVDRAEMIQGQRELLEVKTQIAGMESDIKNIRVMLEKLMDRQLNAGAK